MFFNVRLMIVATLGSVVILGCGFALFAAFRVNHEPLARLPSASAPLRFAANSAAAAVTIAAGESFGSRFQFRQAYSGDDEAGDRATAVLSAMPPVPIAEQSASLRDTGRDITTPLAAPDATATVEQKPQPAAIDSAVPTTATVGNLPQAVQSPATEETAPVMRETKLGAD